MSLTLNPIMYERLKNLIGQKTKKNLFSNHKITKYGY